MVKTIFFELNLRIGDKINAPSTYFPIAITTQKPWNNVNLVGLTKEINWFVLQHIVPSLNGLIYEVILQINRHENKKRWYESAKLLRNNYD